MQQDDITQFFSYLKKRLEAPLPGQKAQIKMAPLPSKSADHFPLYPEGNSNLNSVLIPLYSDSDNDISIILTLRTRNVNHGGQISFPGGQIESNESAVNAALRETHEEIGISRKHVKIAGKMTSLYIHRTNNMVEPFVGMLTQKPDLHLSNREVEEIIPVKISTLADKNNITVEEWELRKNSPFKVPYWNIHKVPLWGATAMMLSELIEIYNEYKLGIKSNIS